MFVSVILSFTFKNNGFIRISFTFRHGVLNYRESGRRTNVGYFMFLLKTTVLGHSKKVYVENIYAHKHLNHFIYVNRIRTKHVGYFGSKTYGREVV